MGVSKNSGTPKSSILIGFSIINHPFWGYPYFRKHLYVKHFIRRHVEEHLFQLPNRRLQFLHEIISLLKPWTEPTWNGVTTPPSTAHPGDSFEGIHHGCQPKRRLDFRFRNALKVAEKLRSSTALSESSCWKSTVCVLRQKPTKSLCQCVTENKPQLLWSGRSLARIFVLDVSDGGDGNISLFCGQGKEMERG